MVKYCAYFLSMLYCIELGWPFLLLFKKFHLEGISWRRVRNIKWSFHARKYFMKQTNNKQNVYKVIVDFFLTWLKSTWHLHWIVTLWQPKTFTWHLRLHFTRFIVALICDVLTERFPKCSCCEISRNKYVEVNDHRMPQVKKKRESKPRRSKNKKKQK